jgi:hypothetical protein
MIGAGWHGPDAPVMVVFTGALLAKNGKEMARTIFR